MQFTRRVAMTAVAAAMAASPARAQDKPPLKMAQTSPMTGVNAQVGALQAIATDLAVADINASGGVNGSKIDMTHYDDQLKPDQGVLRVREAMNAGNFVVIGPISGTQWETVSPMTKQLKFPAINVNANKPGINVRPYSLRMQIPDDTGMPEAFDDFLKHYPNVKKVVVMGDTREASGKAAVDLWQDLAKQRHLEILDVVTYVTGQTDYSSAALKVKSLNPDAILISTLAPDAIRIGREFKSQSIEAPVIGNSLMWAGVLAQVLSQTIGKEAAHWHATGFSTNEQSNGDPALYKKFVERYDEAVLKDPAMSQYTPPNVANASISYDAVLLAADLLRKAGVDGSTPVDKAREALKDGFVAIKDFKGLNYYKFTDAGDAYIPMHALAIDPDKREWQFLK